MQVTKPRIQRKRLFQAPAHRRYRYFSAPLSPDLKKKHGTNAIPVRMGDTVRIMRGDRKGLEGKITRVNREKYRVFVEGVTRSKVDGTTIPVPLHPSKVMITSLNLDDKWRRETLSRKGTLPKEVPSAAVEAVVEEKLEAKKAAKKPRRKRKKKEATEKPALEKEKKTTKTEKPKRKRTKKAKAEEGAE